MNVTTSVALLLFLAWLSSFEGNSQGGLELQQQWRRSNHLTEWYSDLDMCVLRDHRNVSVENLVNDCINRQTDTKASVPPVRCRVGNTWPSRSMYCDSMDIPFPLREHLFASAIGLDQPQHSSLRTFFEILAKNGGLLLLVGDSVTQQFYSAIACELERVKVWTDSSQFTNTDEVKHVSFGLNSSASIQFLPVYHLVNGRHDKTPNAALRSLQATLRDALHSYRTIFVLINMGLHYVDNPIAGFTRVDYETQVTTVLTLLHRTVIDHPNHAIRIMWRETTAQHFPTPNGYWPGVKYSHNMDLKCVPIQNPSPSADWRNRIVEQVILRHNLFSIRVLRFYNMTLPLWEVHPNGKLRDCTHFCWFPMLFQAVFRQMSEVASDSNYH